MYNVDITGIYTDRIILEDEKCTLKDNRELGWAWSSSRPARSSAVPSQWDAHIVNYYG